MRLEIDADWDRVGQGQSEGLCGTLPVLLSHLLGGDGADLERTVGFHFRTDLARGWEGSTLGSLTA